MPEGESPESPPWRSTVNSGAVHTFAGKERPTRAMNGHEIGWTVANPEQLDAVVHLFAGPYVTVGTERREVPEGSKQLLALVALRRRRIERRQAAGTLWPFGDEERAAGNLRSALWRLRRAGINVLVADKWSLALGHDVQVDLHLMEQWAARLIEGRVAMGDLAVSPSVADALDLLPGFYEDWALMERERIRQRTLHALEALSERLTAVGRFADAIEAAILATNAEPLRESAQRTLIRAHIAEGNLTEARRSYRAYHDLVHRELGLTLPDDFVAGLDIREAQPSRAAPRRASPSRNGAPVG
jgi:DNA-binding SARP family transcriptional activator